MLYRATQLENCLAPAWISFYSNAKEVDEVTALMLQFAVNHPCGAGHFPGNPIVPGALLLDEVLTCIATNLDIDGLAWRIKSAKFPQSVRPGDIVHINYTYAADGEIRFECTVSNSKVMSGIASSPPVATESLPL
jgi:3-hydroxymyristoyl/3-hydroxydecanoyl-(acyl carrier protein) dehydratase